MAAGSLLLLIHADVNSDVNQSHLSHMGTLRDHCVSLPALSQVLQFEDSQGCWLWNFVELKMDVF